MNALSGLRYDLLQSTDIGGAFNRGMEMGTQMRERRDQRNALNLYATDPAGAINALMPVNPEMAMRLNDDYRAGEKTKREATFREAASGYIGGDGDAADAEFLRMVEIDPMAAMKIKSAKRDEAFDRLRAWMVLTILQSSTLAPLLMRLAIKPCLALLNRACSHWA